MSQSTRALSAQERAWCLYDWANSAFATTVMAAMYPPFFRSLAVAAGIAEGRATAYWGYTSAVGLALVAIFAPMFGAMADHAGLRKRFLAFFAGLGILATAATALNGPDTWLLAATLYVAANVGFAGGNAFYESLLPALVPLDRLPLVSAHGYAYGYLGGGLLLLLNTLWVLQPRLFGMADSQTALHASFVSVALWWAVFSIPLFRRVPEPPAAGAPLPPARLVTEGVRRLTSTFKQLARYRQLTLFLVAFWLYNDGVSTIIKMATAYGDEIGIGLNHLIGALLLTQFIGFPAAILFGRLGAVIGSKRAILVGLTVYTAIAVGGFFMVTPLHFYLLAAAVGTVQGGTQALSRSLFAAMVPATKSAEFFGFFGASGKFAGIAGPLVFAIVAELTGQSRWSILSLIVFFVVGALVLMKVDVAEGERVAAEEASTTRFRSR